MARGLYGSVIVLLALFAQTDAASQTVNQDLSDIFNELWKLDVNRMKPGTDYRISLQGKAGYIPSGSTTATDHASAPLFSYVDENKLNTITTYTRFMKLLDNYERSTGVAERVTSEEVAENNAFLDAVLESAVMKRAHQYLVNKGKSQSNLRQFKSQLYYMWFRLYHRDRNGGSTRIPLHQQLPSAPSRLQLLGGPRAATPPGHRSTRIPLHQQLPSAPSRLQLLGGPRAATPPGHREDSSGFEHVFVGETKFGKEIMGLHNWVQFYLQEKQNLLDYKGYKARSNDVPDEDDHVLNVQFSWHGLVKPVGSTFMGVSPEFEMAVFTILFLTSTEKTTTAVVNLDEYQLELVVHRHGRSIGTSYPKLLSSNNRHL